MLIVTYKNVHSFLDRNINRFPNKNVERSLAKFPAGPWLRIADDYQSYQFRLECFQLGLFSDIKSDSEGVHHEVGAIIVSLKLELEWIVWMIRSFQNAAVRSMKVRIIIFTFLDSQYEKTFKFGTWHIQHYFHNIQNKGIVFARLSVSYRLSMLWNHILTITNQGSTV